MLLFHALIYKTITLVLKLLPFSWSFSLAHLFKMGYWLSPQRTINIRENLSVVCGTNDIEKKIRQVFLSFGRYFVEFLCPQPKKNILDKKSKHVGVKDLLEVYNKKKGVIALTCHIGNWELAGYFAAKLGIKVSGVFLSHLNPSVDKIFMNSRKVDGLHVIRSKQNPTRRCLEVLRRGEMLAIAGDIDFLETGLEVQLFGKKTKISRGPIILSKRTGAPIVPGGYVRDDTGGTFFFYEAIYPDGKSEGELGVIVAAAIERMIKENPTQWYCFEKMWK